MTNNKNNYYYRISAKEDKDTIIYTKSIVEAKMWEDVIARNGYTPQMQKLTKFEIPMSEIHLVNGLQQESKASKIAEATLREMIREAINEAFKS